MRWHGWPRQSGQRADCLLSLARLKESDESPPPGNGGGLSPGRGRDDFALASSAVQCRDYVSVGEPVACQLRRD